MVEAAALARTGQEQSDDSEMDSAQELDETEAQPEPSDAEVWFVQNGPWGKVHLAKPGGDTPRAACGAKLCLVALWVKSFDHNLRCRRKACCA